MVRAARFEITQKRTDSALSLSIAGELDMRTTDVLWQQLEESLASGISELTLDLTDLEFMDSTGLRLLIRLNDRSQDETWRLRLLFPKAESAALVLRVTGTDAALPFKQATER
jgi:anti-anti-sigma factor